MAYSSYEELPDDDYIDEEPVIDINFVQEPSYTETADAITFGTGEDAISIPIATPTLADVPQPETNIDKPVDTFSLGSGVAVMEAPAENLENESDTGIISNPSAKDVTVKVNDTLVTLKGKIHYLLVDVLDFYPFDMSEYRGRLILEINGVSDMDFTSPVHDGDQIRIAWSE